MGQDTSIRHVLNLYQTFAKEKREANGFRIQLASNNSREALMNLKARFMMIYPETDAYLEYQSPQFKLRAGDFRKRSEAETMLEEVRKDFPAAFIVPDKIIIEGVQW